jgi:hypothetical protein
MAKRKATAELLARAESNGYKRGAHREEDNTQDNRKHNDKIKRNQNAVLDHYCQQGRRARLVIDFSTGCACVWRARRVRNDNFSSTIVQRLNAGERNIPSLVQQGLIGGSLGQAWHSMA